MILIIYESIDGASLESAQYIKDSNEAQIFEINELKHTNINFNLYKYICFIAGIHYGKWSKNIIKYINQNIDSLKDKNIFYIVHGLLNFDEAAFDKEISDNKINIQNQTYFLGGKIDYQSKTFVEKLLLSAIARQNNMDKYDLDTTAQYKDILIKIVEDLNSNKNYK